MFLGIGLTLKTAIPPSFEAPEGFAFVVTDEGEYVTDDDAAYVITAI